MQLISLNGTWRFREVGTGDVDTDPHLDGWIPASVPGCVHTDLIAAGRIPEPFYRMNAASVRWIADKDWLYARDFEVSAAVLAHDRVELVCEGLDTFATVLLNGREIARVENALHEHVFEVKSALREGRNTLAVRFDSSNRIATEREERYGKLPSNFFGPAPYARKPPYATGWDWGPVLPSCGLWRDVFLRAFSTARIESIHAPIEIDEETGTVRLSVELRRTNDMPVTVLGALSREGETAAVDEVGDVRESAELELSVKRPYLWWPAGYGDPDLYDLSVCLRAGDKELDRRELRIGFRTCEIERTPDAEGESFIFKINGRRIYCKGANWIPADSFPPRVSREKYRDLLELAVEQNANMIRVWGGGIYEPDLFYDLCDELGLMVWQDFMFACADYPDMDWFHDLVRTEAELVVRRLRNHPSLVLWCGNNENQWAHEEWKWPAKFSAEKIYHNILPETCKRLDPTRLYWPSSPYGGPKANCETHGDHHNWIVWHRSRDYDEYRKDRSRFVSEFGYQSLPTFDTILEFAEPEDLSMDSEVMRFHQRAKNGNERLKEAIDLYFRPPEDFERAVLFTQIIQGEALKAGIEHWRRLKWHNAGALYWQLNDCWPAISWATVDSALRPKPAYYYARRAFAPVLLTAHLDGDDVVVSGINDTDQAVSGTVDIELFDMRGEGEMVQSGTITLPADAAAELCRIPTGDLDENDRRRRFLWLTLYSAIYSSSTTFLFERAKNLDLLEPDISVEIERDKFDEETTVRLTSPVFVKGVWLSVPGTNARFSDNAFDLVPYVPRDVVVSFRKGAPIIGLEHSLKIQHCNVVHRGDA